jgi:uncharacterized protein YhaN
MNIQSIYLERYGDVIQREIKPSRGLTVIYGPNEAGKSSMMGLTRSVLFGFPVREAMEVERTGPWGGRLMVETSFWEQAIMLERREATPASSRSRSSRSGVIQVTLSDGTRGGEELLRPLIGGVSGEQYRSVFAFGLTELQELRTLQSEEVSVFLYSAGLGIDGRAILAAERSLVQQMEQLYRPRGKNQRMSSELRAVQLLEAELRESKERQGRYDALAAELAALDAAIAAAAEQLRERRAELAWLEAAQQAAGHRRRSLELAAALAALPPARPGATDALARFERLADEMRRVCADAGDALAAAEQGAAALAALPVAEPALAQALRAELEPLAEALGGYASDAQQAAEQRHEAEQAGAQLAAQLRQLGGGWTAETLSAFPPLVPARLQARAQREQLEQTAAERGRLAAAQEHRRREYAQAVEQAAKLRREGEVAAGRIGIRLESELAASTQVLEIIAKQKRYSLATELPSLRRLVRQRDQLRLELKVSGLSHNTQQANRRSAHQDNLQSFSQLARTARPLLLAATAFLAGAALWLAFALPLGKPALAYAGFGAFALASAAIAGFAIRSASRPNTAATASHEPEPALVQLLRETEEHLAAKLASLAPLPELASANAFGTGTPARAYARLAPVHVSSLNSLNEETLEQLERLAQEWQEATTAADTRCRAWIEAEEALQAFARRIEQEQQLLDSATQQLVEAQHAWGNWLQHHQFPATATPDAALEMLHQIEQCTQLLDKLRLCENKFMLLQGRLNTLQQTAVRLLGPTAANEPILAIRLWKQDYHAALERQRERQKLEEKVSAIRANGNTCQLKLLQLKEQAKILWASFNAIDEYTFREQISLQQKRQMLEDEKQKEDSMISALIGSDSQLDRLDMLLHEDQPYALVLQIDQCKSELAQHELEQDQRKDRRGRLAGEQDALEHGTTHGEKLQQLEEHRAALVAMTAEWAPLAMCATLIRQTKALYERERQPALLQAASNYFRSITGGRYTRIVMPLGEQRIVAERASGELVDSSQMSRGTAEQLYLALRFALIDEVVTSKGVSLPILMDDILVNFDRDRQQLAQQVIIDLANRHQILFFTCHPHVVETFHALDPSILNVSFNEFGNNSR